MSFSRLSIDFEVRDNSFAVKRQNPRCIDNENSLKKFGFTQRFRDICNKRVHSIPVFNEMSILFFDMKKVGKIYYLSGKSLSEKIMNSKRKMSRQG